MQKQLFSLGVAQSKKFETLPETLLSKVKSEQQALSLMVTFSGLTHESLANEIGKPRETVTRFLNGNGGLDFKHFLKLINATGNLFLLQVMANHFGYDLVARDEKANERAMLKQRLAELGEVA